MNNVSTFAFFEQCQEKGEKEKKSLSKETLVRSGFGPEEAGFVTERSLGRHLDEQCEHFCLF